MGHRQTGLRAVVAGIAALGLALVAGCHSSGTGGGSDGAGNGLSGPVGSAGATNATSAGGPITVVAAENFWGNIVSQIGGSQVTVTSIISDPNADPHEYESDATDAAAIAHANLAIVNGAGYDDFMTKLLSASPSSSRQTMTVAQLVGVTGSNPNPHLWYDPSYVDTAARAFAAELGRDDPSHAASFTANLTTFLAAEQGVVAVIDEIKARYSGTAIAYTERVPGYLIQAAGLHLGTPTAFSQAIEDGTDPSPLDNATFEKDLADHTVKVLLYNAQVTDSETVNLRNLATRDGVPVVGVTETLPPSEPNFQTWQLDQAKALLAALGG